MATISNKKKIIELAHQISELEKPEDIWRHFLHGIKEVTNSHSSFLQQNDFCIEHQPLLISNGVDDSLIAQYLTHYYSRDIWAGALLESKSGTFHNIQQLVDQKIYLTSELFNDLQRHQNSYYSAGLQLNIRNQTGIMLTFHRDKKQGEFDGDDVFLLNSLVPILYETLWRISDKYLLATESDKAVAYIDEELNVVDANSAFYKACSESDELEIQVNMLCLRDLRKADELGDCFRRIFYSNMVPKKSGSIEIKLYDEAGEICHSLILTPCYHRTTRFGFNYHGMFLRLELKSYQRIQLNWERIQACYKLTAAELTVLQYFNDVMSRKKIAQKRLASPETVKSQMKSLGKKLNARSQVELMKVIRSHSYYIDNE